MIPGVLCTGNIVMDLLAHPVEEITWGGTRWVESIVQSLGGNGANTSAALAKLGVPVKLIGAVGRDEFGSAALKRLVECGVDISCVTRMGEAATATTVALVRQDGRRAFLHQPGVSRLFYSNPVEWHAEACTRFHIGNPFAVTHLRRRAPELLREARDRGLRTSLDTAWDAMGEWMTVLHPCLAHADILFTNEDEARMLTGSADASVIVQRFRDAGADTIVLKLGAKGCAVFTTEGDWAVPAYPVQAVDTTGAGDCFAGGYLAALQRGLSHPEAARIANATGALNVQSMGGTSGLRTWDETIAWANGFVISC